MPARPVPDLPADPYEFGPATVPAQRSLPPHDDDRPPVPAAVWSAVVPHRSRLLALARSCGCDPDQAHDVAQEALLRAAVMPGVDPERVGGLLTVIARRLAVDQHRLRRDDVRLTEHRGLHPVPSVSHEVRVCEQAEGAWLHAQAARLPARDRTVLLARAAGRTPADIAGDLGVSVRAVESVARRVRIRLKAVLATTWAAAFLAVVPLAAAAHPPARPVSVQRVSRPPGRGTGQDS